MSPKCLAHLSKCPRPDCGLVVRVSTLKLGGWRFDPRSGHTKDSNNGTQCLPAWHSASRVGLGVSPCDILASCPGGVLVHHTSVMSRGCTCTSSCLTLQKQEIGSWPMGLMARQGYLLTTIVTNCYHQHLFLVIFMLIFTCIAVLAAPAVPGNFDWGAGRSVTAAPGWGCSLP